jgi:Ala-tRNA(Pro) deacylase
MTPAQTQSAARSRLVTERLVDELSRVGAEFELLPHRPTITAAEEARVLGMLEQAVAKTLVARDDEGRQIRAVVPASQRLDLDKLGRAVGGHEVTLLTELELLTSYPQFELGAVPPFGGPAGDEVVVDRTLAERDQVVLEAGVHDTSLRLRTDDLLAVAGAQLADIATD